MPTRRARCRFTAELHIGEETGVRDEGSSGPPDPMAVVPGIEDAAIAVDRETRAVASVPQRQVQIGSETGEGDVGRTVAADSADPVGERDTAAVIGVSCVFPGGQL